MLPTIDLSLNHSLLLPFSELQPKEAKRRARVPILLYRSASARTDRKTESALPLDTTADSACPARFLCVLTNSCTSAAGLNGRSLCCPPESGLEHAGQSTWCASRSATKIVLQILTNILSSRQCEYLAGLLWSCSVLAPCTNANT